MFCIPSWFALSILRARAQIRVHRSCFFSCAHLLFFLFTYKHRDGVMNTEIKERKMTLSTSRLGRLAKPEELESTKNDHEDHEEHATHGQGE